MFYHSLIYSLSPPTVYFKSKMFKTSDKNTSATNKNEPTITKKNLLSSLLLFNRIQRFFGLFPFKIEHSKINTSTKSFIIQLIVPILNTLLLIILICVSPVPIISQQENFFRKSSFLLSYVYYYLIVFCANYKNDEKLEFLKTQMSVDDVMENRLGIHLNHTRIPLIVRCINILYCFIYVPKLWPLFKMDKLSILYQVNKIICNLSFGYGSSGYFIWVYILVIRSTALHMYVRKIIKTEHRYLSKNHYYEQLLHIMDVHCKLRDSVKEINRIYGKRVFATYLKEGYIVTIQLFHLYTLYTHANNLREIADILMSILLDTLLRCLMIVAISYFCHVGINMVTNKI